MQPGLRMVQEVVNHLTLLQEGRISFEISRASCSEEDTSPVHRDLLREELAKEIFDIGDDFYGAYLIIAGMRVPDDCSQDIIWLAHTRGQSGLGFTFGEVQSKGIVYPARRYALRPKGNIDVNCLYKALTGRGPIKGVFSGFKPPAETVLLKENALTLPIANVGAVEDTGRLAMALAARKKHRDVREGALADCAEVEAEIASLEQQKANRPSFADRVATRLAEVRTQYGL